MQRDPLPPASGVALKVAVVSPHRATLESVRALLEGTMGVAAHLGGAEVLDAVAGERPDVLLVEEAAGDLIALEAVTSRHPRLAVVLLSANHSSDFLRHA